MLQLKTLCAATKTWHNKNNLKKNFFKERDINNNMSTSGPSSVSLPQTRCQQHLYWTDEETEAQRY